ncbi:condensation domain-containing protein [Streptomyces stramineus]
MSANSSPSRHEIGRAPAADWYPLSSAQLAIWLTTQTGGAHGAYTVPGVYRLSGALDAAALRRAFEDLLVRHESLRTAFEVVDGIPRQRPVTDATLDWTYEVAEGDAEHLVEEFTARGSTSQRAACCGYFWRARARTGMSWWSPRTTSRWTAGR